MRLASQRNCSEPRIDISSVEVVRQIKIVYDSHYGLYWILE